MFSSLKTPISLKKHCSAFVTKNAMAIQHATFSLHSIANPCILPFIILPAELYAAKLVLASRRQICYHE